jgi:hypothetical protein
MKHPRKLKLNKHFTPCAADEGDELYPNGIFVFNVSKMTDYITASGIPCEEVLVSEFNKSTTKFNDDYLATVDITKPIIVAEIAPGRYNVINGNHRLERARRTGVEKLPAYRLAPEQHLPFLITDQGYRAYIEYWNSKLKEL